jgi:hypothetical protein
MRFRFSEFISQLFPKKYINSNIFFFAFLIFIIDISGISLLSQDYQKVEAQKDIQIRTDQWLKVEEVTGNVTYRNFYNYDNRPARVGDLLQTTSDETHIPLVMEGDKQLRNRHREEIVALASRRKEI